MDDASPNLVSNDNEQSGVDATGGENQILEEKKVIEGANEAKDELQNALNDNNLKI